MPGRKHHHRRKKQVRSRGRSSRAAVSPWELIREDFQRMLYTMRLRATGPATEAILMQSCEGHAQMGHGAFAGRRFPNTEMEDIVAALGRDPMSVARERQVLIDEVVEWVDRALEGEAPRTLVNGEGEGLIGCGLLRHLEVSAPDVLRGIYLGGLRDDSELRLHVEQHTGLRIGGGHSRFVDTDVMQEMGLNGDRLANGDHADKLEEYRQQGLIVDDPGPSRRDDRVRYMYVRERTGGGTSDDVAIIAAGKLYNLSVALGVFLADAIDTLEKFVVEYSDQDDDLARHIEEAWPDPDLTLEDVSRIIWLCAIPPEQEQPVPDSSLRHLLEIDPHSDQTALESHLAYLQGNPYSRQLIASEDVPNVDFYQWFEARFAARPS